MYLPGRGSPIAFLSAGRPTSASASCWQANLLQYSGRAVLISQGDVRRSVAIRQGSRPGLFRHSRSPGPECYTDMYWLGRGPSALWKA